MRRFSKFPALCLAVALQFVPLCRMLCTTSATPSSGIVVIMKWCAGALALLGSYHAVSGASTGATTTIVSPGTARGTNGVKFRYQIITAPFSGNTFNAAPLPAGLTVTSGAISSGGGVISGTPTESGSNWVLLTASDNGQLDRTTTKFLALVIDDLPNTPPGFAGPLKDQFVALGATATFTAGANGSSPLSYQWRFNGQDIQLGTNASLAITNAGFADEGNYSVHVMNAFGEATSSSAKLTILIKPAFILQPQSQTVVAGDTVSFTAAVNGSLPLGFRLRRNGVTVTNLAGFDRSVTFTLANVQTNQSGDYSVLVTNAASAGVLSVKAVLTVLDPLADNDGDGVNNRDELAAGTDPNDPTKYPKLDSFVAGPNATTVSFQAMFNKTYTVQFKESLIAGRWTFLADVSALPSNRVETVTDPYPMTEGRLYRMMTPRSLPPLPGPVILTSPQTTTVFDGANATLNVFAVGQGVLNYQWRFNDADLVGETNVNLVLLNLQTNQIGAYVVGVSDDLGTVTTEPAQVKVLVRPVITKQPGSQTVAAGSGASFSVIATGFEPLMYRWRFNGHTIAGETNAMLNLANVQAASAGSYSVLVRHQTPYGPAAIRSQTAILTVMP